MTTTEEQALHCAALEAPHVLDQLWLDIFSQVLVDSLFGVTLLGCGGGREEKRQVPLVLGVLLLLANMMRFVFTARTSMVARIILYVRYRSVHATSLAPSSCVYFQRQVPLMDDGTIQISGLDVLVGWIQSGLSHHTLPLCCAETAA